MRIDFLPRLFRDPNEGAAAMNPVGAVMAGLQGALGIVQTISANNKLKKLLAQRTAYKTPEEYIKLLNAAQSRAQTGFDPYTLNYLTSGLERGFASSVEGAVKLGANPNDLSAIYDQFSRSIMQIGAENQRLNMENFSKFLNALDVIGQNKAAEWRSQQDIIKDKMQAASMDKMAGIQNIGSAMNAFISLDASRRTSNLFK